MKAWNAGSLWSHSISDAFAIARNFVRLVPLNDDNIRFTSGIPELNPVNLYEFYHDFIY